MKLKLVLRLVVFLVVCIWVLSFLGIAILMLDPSRCLLLGLLTGGPDLYDWIGTIYVVWYFFTAVVVATFVALEGFRLVGRWSREEAHEEEKN